MRFAVLNSSLLIDLVLFSPWAAHTHIWSSLNFCICSNSNSDTYSVSLSGPAGEIVRQGAMQEEPTIPNKVCVQEQKQKQK